MLNAVDDLIRSMIDNRKQTKKGKHESSDRRTKKTDLHIRKKDTRHLINRSADKPSYRLRVPWRRDRDCRNMMDVAGTSLRGKKNVLLKIW
jgi:hypothetical protein